MKIGYARVSTERSTAYSSTGSPQAGRMWQDLPRKGLRILPRTAGTEPDARSAPRRRHRTVWKLDRLARSTRNLLEIVEAISQAGARFQSISEPWADTTTHAGKMIMTIFAGIGEFERDLIRERTGAGRADAQKRGVRFGRPKKMNEDQEGWHSAYSRKASLCARSPAPSASTRHPLPHRRAQSLNGYFAADDTSVGFTPTCLKDELQQ